MVRVMPLVGTWEVMGIAMKRPHLAIGQVGHEGLDRNGNDQRSNQYSSGKSRVVATRCPCSSAASVIIQSFAPVRVR